MKKWLLSLLIMFLLGVAINTQAEEMHLYRAREGTLWGYINSQGEWVLPPAYLDASPFVKGNIALVTDAETSKLLLINKSSEIIADLGEWENSNRTDAAALGFGPTVYAGDVLSIDSGVGYEPQTLYCLSTGQLLPLTAERIGLGGQSITISTTHKWGDNLRVLFRYAGDREDYFVLLDLYGNRITDEVYRGEHWSDGEKMSLWEIATEKAKISQWGFYPYKDGRTHIYIDASGNQAYGLGSWLMAEPFDEEFGVAWVWNTDNLKEPDEPWSLINHQGQVVSAGWDGGAIMKDKLIFRDGICVVLKGSHYNYLAANGEPLFGAAPFRFAEPFRNGLALAGFMRDDFSIAFVYINTKGEVVFDEKGNKEAAQAQLASGNRISVQEATLEDARRMMVGSWAHFNGENILGAPIAFYEDGTCSIGPHENPLRWHIRTPNKWTDHFLFKPPFVLVVLNEERKESHSYGLAFTNADEHSLSTIENRGSFQRTKTAK